MRKTFVIGIPILIVPLLIVAQQQQTEKIDLNVIHQIKTAELNSAEVAAVAGEAAEGPRGLRHYGDSV